MKPKLPGEGATRKDWLRYWKEVRDWGRKRRDRLARQIKRDKRLVQKAEAKVQRLQKLLAEEKNRPSEHFAYAEFNTKDGTPVPRAAYKGLDHLCENYLEPLRAKFGPVSITSGHRHQAYNQRVGGEPNSVHIYDFPGRDGSAVAADITCASGTPQQWAAFLDSLGVAGLGTYSSFVHLDNRDRMGWGRARWTG